MRFGRTVNSLGINALRPVGTMKGGSLGAPSARPPDRGERPMACKKPRRVRTRVSSSSTKQGISTSLICSGRSTAPAITFSGVLGCRFVMASPPVPESCYRRLADRPRPAGPTSPKHRPVSGGGAPATAQTRLEAGGQLPSRHPNTKPERPRRVTLEPRSNPGRSISVHGTRPGLLGPRTRSTALVFVRWRMGCPVRVVPSTLRCIELPANSSLMMAT